MAEPTRFKSANWAEELAAHPDPRKAANGRAILWLREHHPGVTWDESPDVYTTAVEAYIAATLAERERQAAPSARPMSGADFGGHVHDRE